MHPHHIAMQLICNSLIYILLMNTVAPKIQWELRYTIGKVFLLAVLSITSLLLRIDRLVIITTIMLLTVIPWALLENGQIFESLEDFILCVNKLTGEQGYAVVLACTKKLKLKITQKVWLICNQKGRIREFQGQEKYHTSSKANKCLFSLIAKYFNSNTGLWLLKVTNVEHNHKPTLASAHPVHRKIALNEGTRADISHALTVQSISLQILSSFCLPNPTTRIDNNYENLRFVSFLFKRRDIHNVKAQIR